ncbi:hypothetical protein C8Q72DRAFT_828905 [Fomitopsis betulina]|nr:hypothetical protein C8Q72DRAFT_828905 [Fomitopsis betulina]
MLWSSPDLEGTAKEGVDRFMFFPGLPGHNSTNWVRTVNGGAFEECAPGIEVAELAQMATMPETSKGPGPRLHGTISLSVLDRIPVEIFDHIIDHIPYAHLPVAALVARSWYASVVHNLYRILEIDSREEYTSFCRRLQASPRVQRWAAGTVELIIGKPLSDHKARPLNMYLDSLPAALSRWLPSLRKLTIQSELRSRMQPLFYSYLKEFRNVVSLRLTDAELDNIMSLQRVIHPLLSPSEDSLPRSGPDWG